MGLRLHTKLSGAKDGRARAEARAETLYAPLTVKVFFNLGTKYFLTHYFWEKRKHINLLFCAALHVVQPRRK